jgi:hypothetical protein
VRDANNIACVNREGQVKSWENEKWILISSQPIIEKVAITSEKWAVAITADGNMVRKKNLKSLEAWENIKVKNYQRSVGISK